MRPQRLGSSLLAALFALYGQPASSHHLPFHPSSPLHIYSITTFKTYTDKLDKNYTKLERTTVFVFFIEEAFINKNAIQCYFGMRQK